ncbi:MAG: M48 family metalloprotease [Alphaproteobacteria bacterium]
MRRSLPHIRLFVGFALLAALAPGVALAQGRSISFIRDAEIEGTIRDYATPIFSVAGLGAEAVRIHIINDPGLNAFVAGGQRIFLNTGLLMRAQHPGQVMGVIAHETGHISGGHLVRLQDALAQARAKSIAAFILGAAAAVVTGEAGAMGAITSGGSQIATRELLQYSRTQEASADAAAMSFLDGIGMSSRGLLEFFEILAQEETLRVGRQSPYVRSHPLSRSRMVTVANHLTLSRYADVPPPADLVERHDRMRAKLLGFLRPLSDVLRIYPETDTSVPARYAQSIALFRQARLEPALALIDSLIAEAPEDPFFHELKGQMLFENGRVAAAAAPYEEAVRLAPDEPLLRMSLAQVLIELNDPALLPEAKGHLESALLEEPQLGSAWRYLVVAHGRLGEKAEMSLAQAEFALIQGDDDVARIMAERAESELPAGSPGWVRAQDIQAQLDR